MARVSKAEYSRWKHDPVTSAFLQDMFQKADAYIATLVQSAGMNPTQDRWITGNIDGLKWLADWEPEFLPEDDIGEDEDA